MKKTVLAMALLCALTSDAATFRIGAPSTTDNDDSCDIAVRPAATLLLPWFEVDVNSPASAALTTLFTVVNTSQYPQIARVTLWTDLGYPVTNFNLFLTGYDVQSINLYDVLGPAGFIPPARSDAPDGDRSLPNYANPSFASVAMAACASIPGPISADVGNDLRNAFTLGRLSGCGTVGLVHKNAVGYATIDVVKSCGVEFPTNPAYYDELLYDNVLIGDYETIQPDPATGNYATGNSLVHIRAVDDLPYTFYDRYTPRESPAMDRRQPLPAQFAARYIQAGTGGFNTNFQIWREGFTGAGAACADYPKNISAVASLVKDVVRFDDHENATTLRSRICIETCARNMYLPETSSTPTSSWMFPYLSNSGDVSGWMFFNLDNSGSPSYSSLRASQNWVVTTMTAEGRYSVAFDAATLANGCTPRRPPDSLIGP